MVKKANTRRVFKAVGSPTSSIVMSLLFYLSPCLSSPPCLPPSFCPSSISLPASPLPHTQSDAVVDLEKTHGYKDEHLDFIQQAVRKFCLNCILPTTITPLHHHTITPSHHHTITSSHPQNSYLVHSVACSSFSMQGSGSETPRYLIHEL